MNILRCLVYWIDFGRPDCNISIYVSHNPDYTFCLAPFDWFCCRTIAAVFPIFCLFFTVFIRMDVQVSVCGGNEGENKIIENRMSQSIVDRESEIILMSAECNSGWVVSSCKKKIQKFHSKLKPTTRQIQFYVLNKYFLFKNRIDPFALRSQLVSSFFSCCKKTFTIWMVMRRWWNLGVVERVTEIADTKTARNWQKRKCLKIWISKSSNKLFSSHAYAGW